MRRSMMIIRVLAIAFALPAFAQNTVDQDRIAGSAKQIKGAIKEGVGKVVGDAKLQSEGKVDQVEGKIQNDVGSLKDTVRDALKK